uniref:Terpene synthase 3 n=1 Tax=Aconitum carmichaelii TaxID=85363 RepID=A0A8E8P1B5_ACOCM|nr:terpene synthase 3 [Aconitum carmichaelii]
MSSKPVLSHVFQSPGFHQSVYVLQARISSSKTNALLRRSANYQKNIWSADFLESLKSDYKERSCTELVEKLKEIVKDMITDKTMESSAKLVLIDTLERLGVGYHFEDEIKAALGLLYVQKEAYIMDNLRSTSLCFRLLRQHGFKVSQDVFNNFKDETGNFRLGLCDDVKGILSLYEASYLGLEDEDILDEAKDFALKHLIQLDENINPIILAKEVARSLELPLHWRMPRSESRYYIEIYGSDEKMNPLLLEFAKLDFNMLQATYQEELTGLSRWWKNLGLSNRLSFARDRLMESYLASVGVAYKPQYQSCREWLTKFICLVITIDDMYDIYGSLDELELFTAAVQRWDLDVMALLPDYMKLCFLALFNTTNDIVYAKYKDHNIDILSHLKREWAEFCKAMLVEARWSKMGYKPSLTEYLENAWVSSSTSIHLVLAFFATEQTVTNDVLQSLNKHPRVIYYSSMILRLCNDIATSSAELERGDVSSAIQCCMCEMNTSEEIARAKIKELISEMWKKLNKSVYDSPFEDSFINIVLNNARTAHSIYQHGDGIGVQHKEAKKRLVELLAKPVT